MLTFLALIAIPALAIVFIDFLPVIKEKEYGTFAALVLLLTIGLTLASIKVMGIDMPEPLLDLIKALPTSFDPVINFMIPVK